VLEQEKFKMCLESGFGQQYLPKRGPDKIFGHRGTLKQKTRAERKHKQVCEACVLTNLRVVFMGREACVCMYACAYLAYLMQVCK